MRYIWIATIILLTSCAYRPIPLATSYPVTTQNKMQAVHHWDVLAADVADRLKTTIDLTFPDATVKPPVFIRFTKEYEDVPFGKAFYHLLRTQLVQRGVNVVTNTEYSDTLLLDYDMQVVFHKDRRLTYPTPGIFTALGGGVWLMAHGAEHWDPSGLAALPALVAADAYALSERYMPGETNTEVLISTTVTSNDQYIFGYNDIYYINDGDYEQYDDHNNNGIKTFNVVGQ